MPGGYCALSMLCHRESEGLRLRKRLAYCSGHCIALNADHPVGFWEAASFAAAATATAHAWEAWEAWETWETWKSWEAGHLVRSICCERSVFWLSELLDQMVFGDRGRATITVLSD